MQPYSGIYLIRNKINGKVYIGQSVDIYKRFQGHMRKPTNAHMASAFKKYGKEAFSLTILKIIHKSPICKILMDIYETKYIKAYQSTNRLHGYNKDSGGANGLPCEESRMKSSQSHMGHPGYWLHKKRPPYTQEYKDKMSQLKTGIPSGTKGKPWSQARRDAQARVVKGKGWSEARRAAYESRVI